MMDQGPARRPDPHRPIEGTEPGDEARIRELRRRIAAGEYEVDADALAHRILESGDLEAASDGDSDGDPSVTPLRRRGGHTGGAAAPEPPSDGGV